MTLTFYPQQAGILATQSIIQSELEHYSAEGASFCWNSTDKDIDAGDTMLFVKNTSDRFLTLSRVIITSSNVACTWTIGIGAATTTPAGTVVTAINLNENLSTKTFDYLAYSDETAVADATPMFQVITPASIDSKIVPLDGIILGKNHYIQINQETETESTSGQVALFGFFESELN